MDIFSFSPIINLESPRNIFLRKYNPIISLIFLMLNTDLKKLAANEISFPNFYYIIICYELFLLIKLEFVSVEVDIITLSFSGYVHDTKKFKC